MRRLAAALTLPLFVVVTFLGAFQAQAQDDTRWVKRVLRQECHWDGTCTRRYHYVRVYRDRQREREIAERRGTQVRGYIQRADDERETGWCRDTKRVVGSQHLTVSGAKNEADKAWIQSIRFYYGEVFMDMSNAKDIKYTCSRSSVGETLGQTFNRCEIEARPCKAPGVQSAEEGK